MRRLLGRTIWAVLAASAIAAHGQGLRGLRMQRAALRQMEHRTIRVGGMEREYELFQPSGDGTMPLVLAFHGGLGTAAGMARLTGLNTAAAARGVMVAYPQGIERHWGDGRATLAKAVAQGKNDIEFVGAMIEDLASNRRADPSRVYVTGISNGGFFAFRVGCELADRIAAIAPVAATMPARWADPNACRSPYPVALLLIHGTADSIIPARGGADIGARGFSGPVLSVGDTLKAWAGRQGCRGAAVTKKLPTTTPDGTAVMMQVYSGCAPGGDVVFYDIVGGGHTWPGGRQYLPERTVGKTTRNLNASEAILDFFLRFNRRLPSVLPN